MRGVFQEDIKIVLSLYDTGWSADLHRLSCPAFETTEYLIGVPEAEKFGLRNARPARQQASLVESVSGERVEVQKKVQEE